MLQEPTPYAEPEDDYGAAVHVRLRAWEVVEAGDMTEYVAERHSQ